jgi:hypothetical protein
MGAPVKGNTLLNYFQVGPELIQCLLEKNSLRKDLYSPGMHIPILMEDEVNRIPDIYYVLAYLFLQIMYFGLILSILQLELFTGFL